MVGFGGGIISEPVFERLDLGAHIEQRFECEPRLFEKRATAVCQTILWQVSDDQPRRLDHRARVWFLEPREHLEQGRLAGTVGTSKSDALSIVDLPADVLEKYAIAEALTQRR